jgi:N,N'-diacetyllegionaminate synthase
MLTSNIKIDGFEIGDERPFIVAEVGINHNGDIDRALEMVHVAKSAGCDAVKFQTFRADEFVGSPSQMFTYKSQGEQVTESMLEMFRRYELSDKSWAVVKAECVKADIRFLSTPQNLTDLQLLLELGIPAVKVGSDDFTNIPLLRDYARSGLPLILSAGMSDMADVYKALEAVGGLDGYPVILLVCTSQYPTPFEDANLRRITTLRRAFPTIPIGFSDHTRGFLASALAVSLGAVFFEKHFTLSHDLPGPDHWFSEDPGGLLDWVKNIRQAFKLLGSPLVRPTEVERLHRIEYQRRLVAACEIKAGDLITEQKIVLRRVAGGMGLPPEFLDHLLGRPSPKSYAAGAPIEL